MRFIRWPVAVGLLMATCLGCASLPDQRFLLPPHIDPNPPIISEGLQSEPAYTADGARLGVTVLSVSPHSLAASMGLLPGDIITHLGPIPCDSIPHCRAGILGVRLALWRQKAFTIQINRDGRPILIGYGYHPARPLAM